MDKDKKTYGTIVYIDDEVEACETIMEFFTLRGFNVLVAFNGEAGHELVRDARPDIVIMDLKIAGTSGIDLIQRFSEEKISVPIIVVTAFQEAASELQKRKLVVERYFTKPYSLVDLHAVVRELLGVR